MVRFFVAFFPGFTQILEKLLFGLFPIILDFPDESVDFPDLGSDLLRHEILKGLTLSGLRFCPLNDNWLKTSFKIGKSVFKVLFGNLFHFLLKSYEFTEGNL